MLKKSLIAIAVLALAMPAMAGSLKIHEWDTECVYATEVITTIDVLIDVGYFIVLDDQDDVTLTQANDSTSYTGTYDTNVDANFDCTLSVSIAASTGAPSADLGASITSGASVTAGVTSVLVVAITADDVDYSSLTAGEDGLKIADLTISVTPV